MLAPPHPRSAQSTAGLDAEVEAVAPVESRVIPITPTPADRRGPFRPERLISSRQRLRGELISHAFCTLDAALLLVVAALAYQGAALTEGRMGWATAAPYGGFALLSLVGLRAVRAYGFRAHQKPLDHFLSVSAGLIAPSLLLALMLALVQARAETAAQLAWQSGVGLIGVLAAHGLWLSLVGHWRRRGLLTPTVVIVGANQNARRLIERALQTKELAVLGVFDDRHERAPPDIAGVPVLGDTRALLGHRMMPFVDRIVIALDASAKSRVEALVDRLGVLPNDITLCVDLDTADAANGVLDRLVDAPLSRISGRRGGYRRMVAKRAQDLIVGLIALILAAPVMLMIALAVKLDSPGPVFFRQRRQGFNNEPIVVWKFRSLHHELRDENALRQVIYGDARVTRVGRFIRATSLDELPQLFNVLTGEMSLVGPRPHAPDMKTGDVQSAQLVAHYAHRHKMKPGMTGWAAIHGSRGPLDKPELVRQRVALDVAYIERQSFWLDLYIMAMTLPCMLGDRLTQR